MREGAIYWQVASQHVKRMLHVQYGSQRRYRPALTVLCLNWSLRWACATSSLATTSNPAPTYLKCESPIDVNGIEYHIVPASDSMPHLYPHDQPAAAQSTNY